MADPTTISGLFGQLNFGTQSVAANTLTNDRTARPENWRTGIIRTAPNGTTPLYALTGVMPSESTNDTIFHWWEQGFATMRVAMQGDKIYTSAALTTAYTGGSGAVGTTVYVKILTSVAPNFVVNDVIQFIDTSDATNSVLGRVTAVTAFSDATYTYLTVYLLQADDQSLRPTPRTMSDATYIQVAGTVNAQGSGRPTAKARKPTYYTNMTQIFKTSIDLTRNAAKTATRTGDPYMNAKADALADHGLVIERSLLWGVQGIETDTTSGAVSYGQPMTRTDGIINRLRTQVPGNIVGFDYDATSSYAAQYWKDKGWKWLQDQMEVCSRTKGRSAGATRLVYCGRKAMQGIQEAIDEKSNVRINISSNTIEFGIKVRTLSSVYCDWHLQLHPLFDYEPLTNCMLVFLPENLRYRYVTDTTFMAQPGQDFNDPNGYDRKAEHFLTECGLEIHTPEQFMFLTGVGVDNTQPLP